MYHGSSSATCSGGNRDIQYQKHNGDQEVYQMGKLWDNQKGMSELEMNESEIKSGKSLKGIQRKTRQSPRRLKEGFFMWRSLVGAKERAGST